MRGYRYAITETKINRQHQVLSLIQSARLTIEAGNYMRRIAAQPTLPGRAARYRTVRLGYNGRWL